MHHYFWVYRRRSSDETAEQAIANNRREYQSLSQLLLSQWPMLKFQVRPAAGTGVCVSIHVDRPSAAIERFMFECLGLRNAQEPLARLEFERLARNLGPRRKKANEGISMAASSGQADDRGSFFHPSL